MYWGEKKHVLPRRNSKYSASIFFPPFFFRALIGNHEKIKMSLKEE